MAEFIHKLHGISGAGKNAVAVETVAHIAYKRLLPGLERSAGLRALPDYLPDLTFFRKLPCFFVLKGRERFPGFLKTASLVGTEQMKGKIGMLQASGHFQRKIFFR